MNDIICHPMQMKLIIHALIALEIEHVAIDFRQMKMEQKKELG